MIPYDCANSLSAEQVITRKELDKRMLSSAGTRKLYMMQLGDNRLGPVLFPRSLSNVETHSIA